MPHPEPAPAQMEEEFSRPVESIMRCEDFKSNFARKLSNRYISRSPVTIKQTSSMKLRVVEKETVDNAPERIEQCSQLSKPGITEQNGDSVRSPDKYLKNIRDTEVSALNMEIETLRWQLAQTESNRQMHIALLKQVVTFLSRVKEHIEHQNLGATSDKDIGSSREVLQKPVNGSDLPRSRSVVHVNKNDYILKSRKLSASKISKSISNVNGFKDINATWNQSKLSLTSDTDCNQKITEEISRLITLANTVVSTKLPDLACKCNESSDIIKLDNISDLDLTTNDSNASLNFIDEDITNAFILNTIYDSEDAFTSIANKYVNGKDETLSDFIVSSSPLNCTLENDFNELNINNKDESIQNQTQIKSLNKRSEYQHVANFIEDESGFSSMSSFQEIGIPIISIIPPSPCKEVGYIDEFTDMLGEAEKWKNDTIDLDKQSVKVFWV